MYTDTLLLNSVDRRLSAYEEKWLSESKVAQLCYDFEETLAGYNELFYLILELNQSWRDDVFSEHVRYCPEFETRLKGLFERWLSCDDMIQSSLGFFEAQNYRDGVHGAEKYRECLRESKRILSQWKKPELSAAIGLREVVFTQGQADKLRELLAR